MNEQKSGLSPDEEYKILTTTLLKWITQNSSPQGVFIRANVVRFFLYEGSNGEATQIGYAKAVGLSKASFNRWASQFCKDFNFSAPGTFKPEAKEKLSRIHKQHATNETR